MLGMNRGGGRFGYHILWFWSSLVCMMGLFLACLAAGAVVAMLPVTTVLPIPGDWQSKGTGGHSQESHVLAKNTSTPSLLVEAYHSQFEYRCRG